MKIIDFARKGNAVRFYLGEDSLTDWYGDDWNDYPYEHNAGTVYSRFVSGYADMVVNFNSVALEPCDGVLNSEYSKDDMKRQSVPCIVIVPYEVTKETWHWDDDFKYWAGHAKTVKFYFGEPMMAQHIGLPPEMQ